MSALPPDSEISRQPFDAPDSWINAICLAMAGYILLVLYPVYGLVRWFWTGDPGVFAWQQGCVALLVAVLFGLFARQTIQRYMKI